MADNLTPPSIDYTSRDYAAFRQSMIDYAGVVMPEWTNVASGDPNDFGVTIIELFAYLGDILSYYTDRVANEAYLSTATQRDSVLAHAANLDYIPQTATAASAVVTFTITTTDSVTIPAGFQISTVGDTTNDPIIFETNTPVTVIAPGGVVNVTAIEGVTVTDEAVGTSCGTDDESYTLLETPVIADSLVVVVQEDPLTGGTVWTVVTNLLDAGPTDNVYSISLDENEALTITFGDNVNGRVPPRGALITAGYRIGGGEDGNVPPVTITEITDPTNLTYPGPVPVSPPSITVTNQAAATGGTDPESTDSIRQNAPRQATVRDRAVTLADYASLALNVSGVGKAVALAKVYTNVTVYIAPPSLGDTLGLQLTLNAVVAYLNSRKMAGTTVVAASPNYFTLDINVDVVVDDRYAQYVVQQAVTDAVTSFFAFANVDFGQTVRLSDLYAVIRGVAGVTSVTVEKLARTGGVGAADVHLAANEIAILQTLNVASSGGVVNSDTSNDIIGINTGADAPSAAGAPVLELIRCDTGSTHAELTWTGGANTTSWTIEVLFFDFDGDQIDSELYTGSYVGDGLTHNVVDIPYIGTGLAASIGFRTRAFNGSSGPALSATTTVAYVCEGTPTGTVVGGGISGAGISVSCAIDGGRVQVSWAGPPAYGTLFFTSGGTSELGFSGVSPVTVAVPLGVVETAVTALIDSIPIDAGSTPGSHPANPNAAVSSTVPYTCG